MFKESYYDSSGRLQVPRIKDRGICDLSGIDLSNIAFMEFIDSKDDYYRHLPVSDLKKLGITEVYDSGNIRLTGTNLKVAEALLTDVNFDNSDLKETIFRGAKIGNTSFKGADLTGAKGINVNGQTTENIWKKNADFEGATLIDAVFNRGLGYDSAHHSMDLNFKKVKGKGAKLRDISFNKNTFFEGADWTNADFTGSDFRLLPDLHKATVTGANFTDAMVTPEQAKFLRSQGITGFYTKDAKDGDSTDCAYKGDLAFVKIKGCGEYCYGQAQCPVKGFNAEFGVHCKTSGGKCPSVDDCIKQSKETAGVTQADAKPAPTPEKQKKSFWQWLCFFCSDDDSDPPGNTAGGDRTGGTK